MRLLLILTVAVRLQAQDPATTLEQALASADQALQAGQQTIADARYTAVARDGEALLRTLPAKSIEPRRRVTATVTAACFNLGIMRARAQQFEPAVRWLTRAAELTPTFPNVQFSLGTVYFNLGQYAKALDPLSRAVAADAARTNPAARRMLALARFNTEEYEDAVTLLRDDPQRDADPSLQYAYGVALVRSGHAAEAEAAFSALLRTHSASAPLNVVLAMAYAEQGDHAAAIDALKRALALDPHVREANATLGLLYFKAGNLAEAETALRAELRAQPDDIHTAHLLATVLDLDGKPDEAITLLRQVLTARPDHLNARYLLGKILLAQGHAPDAIEHLEAAARLAPEAANVRYQLAQAYTKAGRTEQAAREFEVYRQLKDKQRERAH